MRAVLGLITAGLVLVAPTVWGQQPDSARRMFVERAVLQVQASRFQAMMGGNIEKLGTILADDLTYTHTTGEIETKVEFLSSLQSQTIKYESIEPKEVQVRIYDSTAVVTGISAMRVSVREQHFSFSIRFIEVYKKTDGNWQLIAWQATRLPKP